MICPNCDAVFDESSLFCEECGTRFRRCALCGRVYGSWVLVCIYCSESLLETRAIEVEQVNHPHPFREGESANQDAFTTPRRVKPVSRRFHVVELEGGQPRREPPTYEERFPIEPIGQTETATELSPVAKRIRTATTEYDAEEARREEETQRAEEERRSKKAEALNPYWVEKKITVPVTIFLISLYALFFYLDGRVMIYDLERGGFILAGIIIALVGSLLWSISVIAWDAYRRYKVRDL